MINLLIFIVVYIIVPLIIALFFTFLFACARALGFRLVFDKRRKKSV